MDVVIVGGGLCGVMSAYFLAKCGRKVTVIEQLPRSQNSTSTAILSSDPNFLSRTICAKPLSFPSGFASILSIFNPSTKNSDFQLPSLPSNSDSNYNSNSHGINPRFPLTMYIARWVFLFISSCIDDGKKFVHRVNTNSELARQNLKLISDIVREENFDPTELGLNLTGLLTIYRSMDDFDCGRKNQENFVNSPSLNPPLFPNSSQETRDIFEFLTEEQVLLLEPGLIGEERNPEGGKKKRIVGGIFSPKSGCGNIEKFKELMMECCERKYGVTFKFQTQIKNLIVESPLDKYEDSESILMNSQDNVTRIVGVQTTRGEMIPANTVILCAGINTQVIAHSIGIQVPVIEGRVDSIGIEIPNSLKSLSPQRIVIEGEKDSTFGSGKALQGSGVIITRSGSLVKFVDGIRFIPGNHGFERLLMKSKEMYPVLTKLLLKSKGKEKKEKGNSNNNSNDSEKDISIETRLCNISPDGVPIVSSTKVQNLYLVAGLGANSWNFSCASAFVLTNMISFGRTQPRVLSLERFKFL